MTRPNFRNLCFAVSTLVLGVVAEVDPAQLLSGNIGAPAQAEIGRPATPGSYAGVARRTTRRTVARTNAYVNALPSGCTTVVVNSTQVYSCGNTYYQSSGGQYVVVNVY